MLVCTSCRSYLDLNTAAVLCSIILLYAFNNPVQVCVLVLILQKLR